MTKKYYVTGVKKNGSFERWSYKDYEKALMKARFLKDNPKYPIVTLYNNYGQKIFKWTENV